MYESYFRLREKPFDIVPNPAYLYLSRTHRQAITFLRYGLQEGLGFVMMTGGVGLGKTTLIRELIRTLSPEVTLARVFNTRVSSEELIAMINEDFGLDTAGKGKVLLIKELYAFLAQEHAEGRRPVLIVDEAQNLSLDLLEEVRMLSNLETNDSKLMQIMLVGQPELGRVLSLAEMRQLRQRISIACHLQALTRPETEEYIFHRLAAAGNREALSFPADAMDAVHTICGGIPRRINTLCNFLMLTAFTEDRRDVNAEMVRDVSAGLGIEEEQSEIDTAPPPAQVQPLHLMEDPRRRRALLKALGAALHDGNGEGDDGYPVPIRKLGLMLMEKERELEHQDLETYAVLRDRIAAIEERLKAEREAAPGTHSASATYPYCDLPGPAHQPERPHRMPREHGELPAARKTRGQELPQKGAEP